MRSRKRNAAKDRAMRTDEAAREPRYRAPRIDLSLLTIIVHPSPYSKRTSLGRNRKSTIRRRWFS